MDHSDPHSETLPSGEVATAERRRFAIGDVLAKRYRLVRALGRGGMGEVFEAQDLTLGEAVAVKVVRPGLLVEGDILERLKRETQLARRVTHPNVCRTFDLVEHDGLPLVTMELIRGVTLEELLKTRGQLPVTEARELAEGMAAGLAAAHAAGVIHRDFKSSNVLVADAAAGRRVVITDFGLAVASDRRDARLTGGGAMIGTPIYMAPEQVEGEETTARSDIYALGVVLYELVAGRPPFLEDTPMKTAMKRLHDSPPSPAKFAPDLDPSWEAAILRCLARKPEDRFASPREVIAALGSPPPPPSRRRFLLGLGAGGLTVAAGGAAFALWPRSKAAAAPLRPERLAILPDTGWQAIALAEALAVQLEDVAWIASPDVVARIALEHDDPRPIEPLRASLAIDAVLDAVPGAVRLRAVAGGDGIVIDEPVDGDLVAAARRIAARVRTIVGREASEVDGSWPLPGRAGAIQAYAEGLDLARRHDPVAARERLEQVTRRDPTFCLGHLALARVLETLGAPERIAEAKLARDLAATLPPAHRHAVVTETYALQRDWAHAAEAATAWFAHSPERLGAAIALAKWQAWAKHPEEAKAALAAARPLARCEQDLIEVDLADYRVAEQRRDFPAARKAAEAATARARELGATLLVAFGRRSEAWMLYQDSELEAMVTAAAEAKALDMSLGNRAGALVSLNLLGGALAALGHLDSARAEFEEAVADLEALGGEIRLPPTLLNLAMVRLALGDVAGARASAERVLTFHPPNQTPGDSYFTALLVLVEIDVRSGKLDAAEARLASIPASEDAYFKLRRATSAAQHLHARDQLAAARGMLEQALGFDLDEEDRRETRFLLARVVVDAGAAADALPHLDAAIVPLAKAREVDQLALAAGLRAESLRAVGRAGDADAAERQLLDRARDTEDVTVLAAAARARARAGDLAPAHAQLAAAAARGDLLIALELGVVVGPAATAPEAERLGFALLARQARARR